MVLGWLEAIAGIMLVDLVLSGDNALVIGAAASKLPHKQRWLAISIGGGGAILLRIMFAILATFLLDLPLLQAIGALVLLVIAIRLLMEREEKQHEAGAQEEAGEVVKRKNAHVGLRTALLTIILADVTMSLDNVLAVGALADGKWAFLIIGLLLSIALLLAGSALVSELVHRIPVLMDLASLVLAWTAGGMLLDDPTVNRWLEQVPHARIVVPVSAVAIVLIVDFFLWRRAWQSHSSQAKRQA